MALEPGTRLGPYENVELRSKGGMGEVYRARVASIAAHSPAGAPPGRRAGDFGELEATSRRNRGVVSDPGPVRIGAGARIAERLT